MIATHVYDLHCHSKASDGSLTPKELVLRAAQQGVTALALTDHDTVSGLAEAKACALENNITLIPGIEISATWQNQCFHIIGLAIDPNYPILLDATKNLQSLRLNRAEKIAYKLEQNKIFGALDAVVKEAGDGMVTRNHFAEFLVSQNYANNKQMAFDKYLAKGKPAYVSTVWASLEEAVQWITDAGGIAVLAHPLRYKLTTNWMGKLLSAFKEAGGKGIEVVTGHGNIDESRRLAGYAKRFYLAGSAGSDFHTPNQWVELGRLASLPAGIQPVWDLFN
ncbi:MAG: PHP domain-containing protein [Methylococcaceae bacterium]